MRLKPDSVITFITSPTDASVESAVRSVRGVISSRTVWFDMSSTPRIMRRSSASPSSSPGASACSRPSSSSAGSSAAGSALRRSMRSTPRAGRLAIQASGPKADWITTIGRVRRTAQRSGLSSTMVRTLCLMKVTVSNETNPVAAMRPGVTVRPSSNTKESVAVPRMIAAVVATLSVRRMRCRSPLL